MACCLQGRREVGVSMGIVKKYQSKLTKKNQSNFTSKAQPSAANVHATLSAHFAERGYFTREQHNASKHPDGPHWCHPAPPFPPRPASHKLPDVIRPPRWRLVSLLKLSVSGQKTASLLLPMRCRRRLPWRPGSTRHAAPRLRL